MLRKLTLITTCCVLVSVAGLPNTSAAEPNIVFVTGDDEYRSEVTMPMIAEILEKRHDFDCTVLYAVIPETGVRWPRYQKNIKGLEALKDADLAVFFMRFRALPDDQLEMILDYVNSGRPIVGLRTSTHAFRYQEGPNQKWNDKFGIDVFGQKWITHHGHNSATDVYVIPEKSDHPILKGIDKSFHCESWLYHVAPLVGDCEPLLIGKAINSNKYNQFDKWPQTQPVAWTKTYTGPSGKTAPVFFTTLGHPEDFENESMRRLIINGIYWALGKEVPNGGADARPVGTFNAPYPH